MKRLKHNRMKPEMIKSGQRYDYHNRSWIVQRVNVFLDSENKIVKGQVVLKEVRKRNYRNVDIIKFASIARRDYHLDKWRKRRAER